MAYAEEGTQRRPFLGLQPALRAPALSVERNSRENVHSALGSPPCSSSVLGAGTLSSSTDIARSTSAAPSSNKLREPYPNNIQVKTQFSTCRFSGSAFGLSFSLTFVSGRSLQLRSAPSINPACAALRGA